MSGYAELHCLSNFTFLRGASHPAELVERAAALGYTALALTDECSVAGIVRAHVAARRHALQLLIGSEFRLADGLRLVVLAADREGYAALCGLITRGRRAAEKGSYRVVRSGLRAAARRVPAAVAAAGTCGRGAGAGRCHLAADAFCRAGLARGGAARGWRRGGPLRAAAGVCRSRRHSPGGGR